jgi:hypothetical protein
LRLANKTRVAAIAKEGHSSIGLQAIQPQSAVKIKLII